MPQTIAQADKKYKADWTKWPVPMMPDITIEPWANVEGCFWREDISDLDIDVFRTRSLEHYDVPIDTGAGNIPWDGTSYGMPYQLIDSSIPKTKVWDSSKPITGTLFKPIFPLVDLPLPDVVRMEGDPNGSSDRHWYGYDQVRGLLYEVITLRASILNRLQTFGKTDWMMGYSNSAGPACWNTNKPWNAPGQPAGVVAGGVPQFPMICRFDEVEKAIYSRDPDASLNHCIFGVLPTYAKDKVGVARATDGGLDGHPVRAGEILRLPWKKAREYAPGTIERIFANTFAKRGWRQFDKNNNPNTPPKIGRGGFPITQDIRWRIGSGSIKPFNGMKLRLVDFEVLEQD